MSQWISVDDRLPKQPQNSIDKQGNKTFTVSDDYIVCNSENKVFVASYMFACGEYWFYYDSINKLKNITHW